MEIFCKKNTNLSYQEVEVLYQMYCYNNAEILNNGINKNSYICIQYYVRTHRFPKSEAGRLQTVPGCRFGVYDGIAGRKS